MSLKPKLKSLSIYMSKLSMRDKKVIISQTLKEQNQLEIEKIAKNNQQTLLEAILEWLEDKDIDIYDFKDHVSIVLLERLKRESIKLNVVKDDSPDRTTNLHQLFLEL